MNAMRRGQIGNTLACSALVLVIVGLLVATWMPAIVAGRQKGAASQPSASQPATTPATAPTTDSEIE